MSLSRLIATVIAIAIILFVLNIIFYLLGTANGILAIFIFIIAYPTLKKIMK